MNFCIPEVVLTHSVPKPNGPFLYRAYGLLVASAIELPELLPGDGIPDILIREESVPKRLANPQTTSRYIQTDASQTLLLLEAQVGANFLVRNGNEILVEVISRESIDAIRLAIFGYCLTALLFQRGYLVLHGNAIKTARGAVTICGNQRAGKSTLTTALYKEGFGIIADDLTAVNMQQSRPTVIPGFPRLKLWKDTLDYFDEPIGSLTPIMPDMDKYNFPLNGSFHHQSERLVAIYIVKKSADVDEPQLRYLSGIEKFRAICSQIRSFRPEQLPQGEKWLLRMSSSLADKINVTVITRPIKGNSIDAVAALVQQDISTN